MPQILLVSFLEYIGSIMALILDVDDQTCNFVAKEDFPMSMKIVLPSTCLAVIWGIIHFLTLDSHQKHLNATLIAIETFHHRSTQRWIPFVRATTCLCCHLTPLTAWSATGTVDLAFKRSGTVDLSLQCTTTVDFFQNAQGLLIYYV